MMDEMWNFISTNNSQDAFDIQQRVYDEIGKFELEGSLSCSLMPGCLNTLQWLSEQDIPLGICTSNSKAAALKALETQNLLHYFNSIIGRDTKYRMKPHPDQLLACFQSLNVEPSRGVMVGDSPKDILAGKVVNAYTIAIPVYFTRIEKLRETNPDIIIDHLDKIPAVLSAI
jgi:HAD superfamily hydrolase (TIGR01509 family)